MYLNNKLIQQNSGQALVMVLLLLTVVFTSALGVYVDSINEVKIAEDKQQSEDTFSTTEAGISQYLTKSYADIINGESNIDGVDFVVSYDNENQERSLTQLKAMTLTLDGMGEDQNSFKIYYNSNGSCNSSPYKAGLIVEKWYQYKNEDESYIDRQLYIPHGCTSSNYSSILSGMDIKIADSSDNSEYSNMIKLEDIRTEPYQQNLGLLVSPSSFSTDFIDLNYQHGNVEVYWGDAHNPLYESDVPNMMSMATMSNPTPLPTTVPSMPPLSMNLVEGTGNIPNLPKNIFSNNTASDNDNSSETLANDSSESEIDSNTETSDSSIRVNNLRGFSRIRGANDRGGQILGANDININCQGSNIPAGLDITINYYDGSKTLISNTNQVLTSYPCDSDYGGGKYLSKALIAVNNNKPNGANYYKIIVSLQGDKTHILLANLGSREVEKVVYRIRPVFNDAIVFLDGDGDIPSQYVSITANYFDADVGKTRKIKVNRSIPTILDVFDYVLYSKASLVKNN